MEAIQKETIFISLNKEMTLDSTKWKKRIHAIELRNLVRWYSREILFFFLFLFFLVPSYLVQCLEAIVVVIVCQFSRLSTSFPTFNVNLYDDVLK